MEILLGTVFVASLLGSLHCIGMCGPIALIASSNPSSNSKIGPTIAYSLGRLLAYATVGALFGALGHALNAGTSLASWQQTATYVAGILMIVVGGISLARCYGAKIKLPTFVQPIQQLLQSGFRRAKGLPPYTRAFVIGGLASLMPCGWLYTFAIAAAGTGSPIWGSALMATFWAGTVPIMVALTIGFDSISGRIQKRVPSIMATLVIFVGFFTIFHRAPVALASEPFKVIHDREQIINQLNRVDHTKLPCCCGESSDR